MLKKLKIYCLISCLFVFAGCSSTVIPKKVTDSTPSYEGNSQNSGFLGYNKDGSGIITERAKQKYNALIKIYGNKFLIPISEDYGLTILSDKNYNITAEALEKFIEMNQWYKEGK